MTVRQLIDKLKEVPQDYTVCLYREDKEYLYKEEEIAHIIIYPEYKQVIVDN